MRSRQLPSDAEHLDRIVRSRFDQVLTLCKVRGVCPELPRSPVTAHWSTPDPAAAGGTDGATYPALERVATDLDVRIGHLFARISTPEGGTAHAR